MDRTAAPQPIADSVEEVRWGRVIGAVILLIVATVLGMAFTAPYWAPLVGGIRPTGNLTSSEPDPLSGDLRGAHLAHRKFDGVQLSSRDLSGASLTGSSLRGAVLVGATLRGADLSRADLRGADLTGADLSGADMTSACLHGAILTRTVLDGAVLAGAQLESSQLANVPTREATSGAQSSTEPTLSGDCAR